MTINNNRCLIENSMASECHNNNVDDDGIFNDYCNVGTTLTDRNTCSSLAKRLLAYSLRIHYGVKHSIHEVVEHTTTRPFIRMDTYDKHSQESLIHIWHIQCTIVVTLIAIALARAVCHRFINAGESFWWSKLYMLEIIVISLPVVLSVNVVNPYVEHIVTVAVVLLVCVVWRSKCFQKASYREFEFGRRPSHFTLLRSTVNLLTALCILAVDFNSFPTEFRKSRRYGAGLMDVGIGLFVCSMASVTSRPKRLSDLRKSVLPVCCLLVLGLARTLVIRVIDYHQDEHEYGEHLNAFFTLGLTKLFATLLLFMIKNDRHVLPLGVGVLCLHEIILQLGMSAFVMDADVERTSFFTANREGFCSLPGFVALYIISLCFAQWVKANDILSYHEIIEKLRHMVYGSIVLWLIVIPSTLCFGIARVTCNMSYVTWMLAIALTMCCLYMFVFDIVLDTICSVPQNDNLSMTIHIEGTPAEGDNVKQNSTNMIKYNKIPFVIEAINFNGLFYFLLANIITGGFNIFLKTEERTDLESVFILLGSMLLTTGSVGLLYRFKIRIA